MTRPATAVAPRLQPGLLKYNVGVEVRMVALLATTPRQPLPSPIEWGSGTVAGGQSPGRRPPSTRLLLKCACSPCSWTSEQVVPVARSSAFALPRKVLVLCHRVTICRSAHVSGVRRSFIDSEEVRTGPEFAQGLLSRIGTSGSCAEG